VIGEPNRLRNAVERRTVENDSLGGFEVEEMSHADEYGADVVTSPYHAADDLAAIDERNARAAESAGLGVLADEATLRAPDGRHPREQPDMAGDAEAARMGETVAVVQKSVWCMTESPQGGEHRGGLPERQQSWNVRKLHGTLSDPLLDDLPSLRIPQDCGGNTEGAVCADGGVEPCDPKKRSWRRDRADESGEAPLSRDRAQR
jgi:hypothetical protein